ncbi:MAG: hypothetical protein ACJ8CX_09465 [Microvirga sp.]
MQGRHDVVGGKGPRPRAATAAIAALGAVAALALPSVARAAGPPTMPLADVRAGAHCSAHSVLQGTTVSSFDADVVDVVAGSVTGEGPRILVRVSGPAVDATGIGPGFSGSPVVCPDAQGVPRIAGAIAESVGDQANRLALATPIEAVLGEPLSAADAARGRSLRLGPRRPLEQLTLSGLAPWLARVATAGAARAGRTLLTVPSGPAAPFPAVDLQPGSAVAIGLAGGDLAAGAVGTVAYRDGSTVWAFGHPFTGSGRRSLLLQDAYVYGIVDVPGQEGGSPKLAAPGPAVGTFSNDAADAVVGSLGAGPRTIPFDVVTRDADRGRTTGVHLDVADESALDDPAGSSPLRVVAALATAQAMGAGLDGAPAGQTARLCAAVRLRAARHALGFCNRYVTAGGGAGLLDGIAGTPGSAVAGLAAGDVDHLVSLLDGATFATPAVTSVRVDVSMLRGRRQAFLLGARGPARVRPGARVKVRLRLRRYRGARTTRTIRVPVPRRLRPGPHLLALTGSPTDRGGADAALELLFASALGGEGGSGTPDEGASSLRQLVARSAAIHRFDGVRAAWLGRGARGHRPSQGSPLPTDGALRISGQASVLLQVVRAHRRRG